MYVSLRGNNYSNNSLVTLTEIGNDKTTALICHTNITRCCGPGSPTFSEWKYPGQTKVKFRNNENELFTRVRGHRTIFLFRKEDTLGPTGIYTCGINDSLTTTNKSYKTEIPILPRGINMILN